MVGCLASIPSSSLFLPPSSRHAAERSQPTHPSRGRRTSVHTLHGSLCHPRVVRHLLEHVRGVLSALLPLASRAGLRGVLARAFPRRARLVEKGRGAGGSSVRGWVDRRIRDRLPCGVPCAQSQRESMPADRRIVRKLSLNTKLCSGNSSPAMLLSM